MEIQKIFNELGGEEKLYSISLDETEMALFSEFQKEFNSKAQKRLRRYHDQKVGQARINRINPEGAETAFIHGMASYPGEKIKRVYREGDNWHFKGELRDGISTEKAKMLENNAAKMRESDPKRWTFHKGLVAGRDELHNTTGYSNDLSNVNHRINARGLGDDKEALEAAKEELRKRKQNGWKSKSNNPSPSPSSAPIKSTATASKAATKNSSKLLKKVGIGGAAVLGTAGLTYAGKKLYDKKKKDKK